ncbi:hypothetical protein, partial [Arthrobacter zhaoguopingii]|uniref:hypothetical protein n=1 Tax=Arthrobacter zhaoguopingii TaxID=2681491 RepID=UPI001AEDEF0B
NQSKNNRYQQTWHTIEFSNNRHYRHHTTRQNQAILAPEQLYKPTRTQPSPQIGWFPPFRLFPAGPPTGWILGSTDPVPNRSCGRHPTENFDQRGYKH